MLRWLAGTRAQESEGEVQVFYGYGDRYCRLDPDTVMPYPAWTELLGKVASHAL